MEHDDGPVGRVLGRRELLAPKVSGEGYAATFAIGLQVG